MCNINPSNRIVRPIDVTELKALLGLLFIAGMTKNNCVNANDLFKTNGTSMKIFRLAMSFVRFKFLLRHLHFGDKRT